MDFSEIVKDRNPSDIPMQETHAYKWWEAGGFADNRIQCKVNYLRSLGFQRGRDTLDEKSIKMLSYIADHLFLNKFAHRLRRGM